MFVRLHTFMSFVTLMWTLVYHLIITYPINCITLPQVLLYLKWSPTQLISVTMILLL